MYHSSTQRRFWTFEDSSDLVSRRQKANQECASVIGSSADNGAVPITVEEESQLIHYYIIKLRELASQFQPAAPWAVVGTATTYLKRFFLKNSAMQFPVREYMITCLYLACKVEEFNLSVDEFLRVFPEEEQEEIGDFVLEHELFLVQNLNFHLTIHNPYRPLEGFLVDIKTRSSVEKMSNIRRVAEQFLAHALNSDSALLFAPSQVALCSVVVGARTVGASVDSYINGVIGADQSDDVIRKLNSTLRKIETVVASAPQNPIDEKAVTVLEQKCRLCRQHFPDLKPERLRSGTDFKDASSQHASI